MDIRYLNECGEKSNEEKGTIIKFDDGATGLVIEDNRIVLLKFSGGSDWYILASDHQKDYEKGEYKVMGTIKEIIVE